MKYRYLKLASAIVSSLSISCIIGMEVPSLKDLALSAITHQIQHTLAQITPDNLPDTLTQIHKYTDRLPDDRRSEIINQLGNYRCIHTLSLSNMLPAASLLLTKFRMLINNSGKKITVYDIFGKNPENPIVTGNEHTKAVTTLALSQNNSLLASGSHDTTIKLWDISDPQQLTCKATLAHHRNSIFKLLFAQGGNILFSGSYDGTAGIWDVTDPNNIIQRAQVPINPAYLKTAIASPDGTSIMYAEQNALQIIDLNSDDIRTARTIPTTISRPKTLAWVGKILAIGSLDKKIQVHRINDDMSMSLLANLTGHKGSINALEFCEDKKLLASGSRDKKIKLWDMSDPAHIRYLRTLFGHKGTIKKIKFLKHANLLVSISDDNTIKIWDISDPAHAHCINTLYGHKLFLTDLTDDTTGDQTVLVSRAADKTIRIWNPTTISYAAIAQALASARTAKECDTIRTYMKNDTVTTPEEQQVLVKLLVSKQQKLPS